MQLLFLLHLPGHNDRGYRLANQPSSRHAPKQWFCHAAGTFLYGLQAEMNIMDDYIIREVRRMPSLNDLIIKNEWSMLSWSEKYGSGIWLALSPAVTLLETIENISTRSGVIQSIELTSYFSGKGSWLPVVHAEHFMKGVHLLDRKTSVIPESMLELYSSSVQVAYQSIQKVGRSSNYQLKQAAEDNDPDLIIPNELKTYMDKLK